VYKGRHYKNQPVIYGVDVVDELMEISTDHWKKYSQLVIWARVSRNLSDNLV
jgi:hypothetical protein